MINKNIDCNPSSVCYYGGVFSVSFSEDSPFLLAIGGSKGLLEVRYLLSLFLFVLNDSKNNWCVKKFGRCGTHYLMLESLEDLGSTERQRDLNLLPDVLIKDESNVI